ncbi:MAG: LamG-like jellyroll fold domain-containing protein [Phycisphaerae bacterium]
MSCHWRNSRAICAGAALTAAACLGNSARAGTLAYWSFNNPNTDGSGNVLSYADDSGNGYTATVVNNGTGTSITQAATGMPTFTGYTDTGAAQFNNNNETSGTTNGSYLSIPLVSGMESTSGGPVATSFTVSAWMKLPADWASSSTHKLYAPLLTDWASPATQNSFLMFVGYNNSTNVNDMYADLVNTDGTTIVNHYEPSASLSPDTWHQIAWAWNASDTTSGTFTMYFDGTQAYTTTVTGNAALRFSTASTMEIGFKTNGGQILSGQLDEMYIFDHALSANEENSLYATNSLAAPEPASLGVLAVGALGLIRRRRR